MSGFLYHVRTYFRYYILLGLLFLSLVLWATVIREDREDLLKIVFLDVGQGDSIFIESPTGTQVLVDGGPSRNLMKEISSVMPWYDRHIDMLIVTNPDRDHYEGFIPLLEKYSTEVVLGAGTDNNSSVYDVLLGEIQERAVPQVVARRGQVIDLGGGVYIEILFPDRDVSGLSPNDGSIVMRLIYRETSVLLQGDSTAKIEEYLITLEGDDLKSDILKTGHHGSKTSTIEEYVKEVDPDFAIISAGEGNSYGHPHKETLDTLNKLNVSILGTYEKGRIVFESDGKEFVLK